MKKTPVSAAKMDTKDDTNTSDSVDTATTAISVISLQDFVGLDGSGGDEIVDHTQDHCETRTRLGIIAAQFTSSLRSEDDNPTQKKRVRKIKVFLKLIFLCSGRILFQVEWCITNR